MDLRLLKLTQKVDSILSFNEMNECYELLSKQMNAEFFLEKQKTISESRVLEKIKEHSNLKFDTSVWIGRRNIDLLCLGVAGELVSLGSRRMKGLAIEVDGEVHNQYGKMRRDNSKYLSIHKLKIGLYTIENGDLNSLQFKALLMDLHKLPRLDTRARKRLKRNICLYTIASNYEHFIVQNYLSDEKKSFIENVRGLL